MPDTVILGADAANAFMDNAAVQATLDKRNYMIGDVQYRDDNGAEFLGRIFGMEIYCYQDGYVNTAGSSVDFIDDDYCVLCCSAARVPEQKMVYGPYHDTVTNVTFLQSRIIVPAEGDSITNILKTKMVSRPIPFIPYIKSWATYRVTD